jgi:hypothetical protein
VIDGNYLLSDIFRRDAANLAFKPSGIYVDSFTGANGISSFIFGKNYQVINITLPENDYTDGENDETDVSETTTEAPLKEIISYVPLFRLRYSLNISTDEMRSLAMTWERESLRFLNEKFQSKLIILSASSSTAISDAVSKQARDEGVYMTIMLLIFFALVCLSISIEGNFHTSIGYLSLCGIISFTLSSGATFGILSVVRIEIIEPMALIVLVVASKFQFKKRNQNVHFHSSTLRIESSI